MQWNWASSLDQLWRSPAFPIWAAAATAIVAVIIVLIAVLRADKTFANAMLAIMAMLALGVAAMPLLRGQVMSGGGPPAAVSGPIPALPAAVACLDGLAGETVETACERVIFASADIAAAAVSYAASQLSRLGSGGALVAGTVSAEQQQLLRAIEQDRYGLVAQVLSVRERCLPTDCALFRVLSSPDRIRANMAERLYDGLVARYSPAWSAAPAFGPLATLPASPPTGKPTTQDFPSAASIPPVNIMTAEPSRAAGSAPAPPAARPAPAATGQAAPARPPAPKKQATQTRPSPRNLTPAAAPASQQPPAADDD